ncbi:hypothetical protein ACQUQU_16020 [Thalassolituus sp. LLYu03]|uniref:hypothetical protein n=1 Tax=Thalassolituus sp. LLYu03 TaxID=3421656 RepID=UPI003D2DE7FA
MRSFALGIAALALAGCADTYPDINNSGTGVPDPDASTNDTFFNADNMVDGDTGTLSAGDEQDYYRLRGSQFERYYNGTLTISLTNLNGDADLEVFDHNLNLLSWSRTAGTDDEVVTLWYDATRNTNLDTQGLHFIKVSSASGTTLNYTLHFSFE